MKILYVGEAWEGSSARSVREALTLFPAVQLNHIDEDHYFPVGRALLGRGAGWLMRPWLRAKLERKIGRRVKSLRPDVLMVYKGNGVSARAVRRARQRGVFTVNIFPDCSPHAHGTALRKAIGEYDLIISTKPFHPAGWREIYGYANRCICVPHGYDPAVHYWSDPPERLDFDVVLAATWREQYQTLMQQLATALNGQRVRLAVIGSGWSQRASQLPSHWEIGPPLVGRAYGEWLRRGRIALAPVHEEMVVGGVRQPGDQDTTRTYNLAAAGCFFLHRRTPYAQSIYDEVTEVPMWDNAEELAELVRKYLPLEDERRAMAARAHARAVPAYSIPNRVEDILRHVESALAQHQGAIR